MKLFRLSFSTGGVEKVEFSTGSASRSCESKKVESKKPFVDCVRKPDLGFSRKRPFSTDKSDCIRNGLRKLDLGFSQKRSFSTDKSDCIRNGLRVQIQTRKIRSTHRGYGV